jgi:hypothetical protein
MLPESNEPSLSGEDKLSVDIIAEQSLDTGVFPCLHWGYGKERGYVTRLIDDCASNEQDDGAGNPVAEATVMNEVVDWLYSQQCDEFWAPRANLVRKVSHVTNKATLL